MKRVSSEAGSSSQRPHAECCQRQDWRSRCQPPCQQLVLPTLLQQRLRLRKADLRQRRDLRRRGDLRRRDNVRHGVRRDLRETHVRIVVRRAGLRDAALAAIG